jgi:hypothetical protein
MKECKERPFFAGVSPSPLIFGGFGLVCFSSQKKIMVGGYGERLSLI